MPDSAYLERRAAALRGRPFALVSDTHFAGNFEIYGALADALAPSGIALVVVTECERPEGPNLLPIAIREIAPADARQLQAGYPFSLFKPLACERSLTDYCTFRRDEAYSGISLDGFMDRYTRFIRAYEYFFARGGVFVGMLHDTFKSAIASRIAEHHGRPVLLPIQYYWWPDGVLFYDTATQGARELQRRYEHYLRHAEQIDRRRAEAIYAGKARTLISRGETRNGLIDKLANIRMSRTSPEPFSYGNFARRRVRRVRERIGGGFAGVDYVTEAGAVDGDFLVFPMHVAPEASILGGAPEFADQFSLIKNVSLNLPLGTTLLVKEHPDQIRARLGARFYRDVGSLPNVRIVHASVGAMTLIRRPACRGVVVINGTLGLEAAFEGKRVFVPSADAAWYAFCDAITVIRRWDDFFASMAAPQSAGQRDAITALFLAMDDCVEPIPAPPDGTFTFEQAGRAGMQAIAAKVRKVIEGRQWA